MMRVVLAALLSHWWRNPLQLFTLLTGLALATGLWSAVQAVNAEARASYAAAAATLGEGRFERLVAQGGQPIAQEVYIALRRAGWRVSPVVEGRLNDVRIIGIEPLTAPSGIGPVDLTAGADLAQFLSGEGQLFATAETAVRLSGLPQAPPVVINPDIAPNTALTDIGIAQRVLGKPGLIDSLILHPDQPLGQAPLARVAPGLIRQAAAEGSDIAQLTDSFHLNLTAFGLLAFAVGIFIVHGSIGLAFAQRRAIVRTLRALGVPLGRLIGVMMAELMLLALIAGALGVALGYVIAAVLLPDVAASLRGLYGADVSGNLQLRPVWWLSGLAIALGGTALAALSALWQLARMPLLASAQPQALRHAAGRLGAWQAGAALALLSLAALLSQTARGLPGGFALLAALLIGGALLLPLLLDRMLAIADRRARNPLAEWFWADTRQQLPGLSLALMALMLAIAANVGVSTMVSSFRLTFLDFLDQRLAAELYIRTASPEETAALITYADQEAEALLPLQSADVTLAGQQAEVFGARDHTTYRDNWRFLAQTPDAWQSTFSGQTAVINEQLARRGGLDLGDRITLAGRAFQVAGIYGDYGNPIGQVVIAEAAFAGLFPRVEAESFGIRLAPERAAEFVAGLPAATGISPSAVIDQAGIKALSRAVFERTFTVTGALNVLTLGVAAFAILMSLLTLASMRLPQLAPVWALGVTRAQIARAELWRAVLLASFTALLALPLGLALAWVLLAVVNVAAFGWELPMYLFPLDYLRLGLLAVLAAVLAALWPARRLARTPPAELLGVFANER